MDLDGPPPWPEWPAPGRAGPQVDAAEEQQCARADAREATTQPGQEPPLGSCYRSLLGSVKVATMLTPYHVGAYDSPQLLPIESGLCLPASVVIPGTATRMPALDAHEGDGLPEEEAFSRGLNWSEGRAMPGVLSGVRSRLLTPMHLEAPKEGRYPRRVSVPLQTIRSKTKTTAESEAAHRLKNRDAQRRFRQRQRESISDAQKAVAELSQKLQELQHEVQQERTSARVIMDTLHLENFHIKRMSVLPEVRAAEQQAMMQCFEQLATTVEGTVKDVMSWRVSDWVEWIGTKYVPKLKELLANRDSNEGAHRLLRSLVSSRREKLSKLARFSCWTWIVYAWNVEVMQKVPPRQRPGLKQAVRLLACLELSRQQEDALLEAHARLRRQFEIAHSELARLLSALKSHEHSNRKADSHSPSGAPAPEAPAHASCNSPGSSDSQASGATQCGGFQVEGIDWGPAGPILRALRRFLEGERWAVYSFYNTVLDATLSLEQEAILECMSYPFAPNWHTMLCALSLKRQELAVTPEAIASMALPDLSLQSPVLAQYAPTITAAELFERPTTDLGMGMRLPYGVSLSPYHMIDEARSWRLPSCEQTGGMRLSEAVASSWQTGRGAPLYWFGLTKDDQDPTALESHEKLTIRKRKQQELLSIA